MPVQDSPLAQKAQRLRNVAVLAWCVFGLMSFLSVVFLMARVAGKPGPVPFVLEFAAVAAGLSSLLWFTVIAGTLLDGLSAMMDAHAALIARIAKPPTMASASKAVEQEKAIPPTEADWSGLILFGMVVITVVAVLGWLVVTSSR